MTESQPKSEQLARYWTEAQPVVAAFVFSVVQDFHLAEDVLQQVAVVLVREFERYDDSRPFLPWALGIARNQALKARRDTAREAKQLLGDSVLDEIQAAFHECEDSFLVIRRVLRMCLEKQPGKIRELLKWRYGDDLKPGDVASRMGLTSAAVRVMLHRTRETLRKCIRRHSHGSVEWN
jgi:RNA polymerase sigma-70 factor (ECF subfamily)